MELLHLLIGDFDTLGVGLGDEMSTEAQTCRRPVMMPAARLLEPSPKTPFSIRATWPYPLRTR